MHHVRTVFKFYFLRAFKEILEAIWTNVFPSSCHSLINPKRLRGLSFVLCFWNILRSDEEFIKFLFENTQFWVHPLSFLILYQMLALISEVARMLATNSLLIIPGIILLLRISLLFHQSPRHLPRDNPDTPAHAIPVGSFCLLPFLRPLFFHPFLTWALHGLFIFHSNLPRIFLGQALNPLPTDPFNKISIS